MNLRNYQNNALNALYDYLEQDVVGNPCIVCPTGSGKSLLIATMCKDFVECGHRVLIVSHRKELLEQQADKMQKLAPDITFGVYSAGLKQKNCDTQVTIAGIQSIYKKGAELCNYGKIDYVIVDEVHLIPAGKNGTGMYHTLLKQLLSVNPQVRLIGLTATPFRLTTGLITDDENFLNKIVFDIPIKQLINEGYLAPLRSKVLPHNKVDFSNLHVQKGEFVEKEVDELLNEKFIKSAVKEFVTYAVNNNRNSVLVFCQSIERAYQTARAIEQMEESEKIGVIEGSTIPMLRDELIADFKSKKLRYLINVNVLTTGFDAPNVDMIVMLRPTMSPGLYVQIAGRGSRICEGKQDCVFLDYGGNIARHGAIDDILHNIDKAKQPKERKPSMYTCTRCYETFVVNKETKNCPVCGTEIPERTREKIFREHSSNAERDVSILSDNDDGSLIVDVLSVDAWEHTKKSDEYSPASMWVSYKTSLSKVRVSSFVCIDHPEGSYANQLARNWWSRHSNEPFPRSTTSAVVMFHQGKVKTPQRLLIRRDAKNPKYWQIVAEMEITAAKEKPVNMCASCIYYFDSECILKNNKERCNQYMNTEQLEF